MAEADWLGPKVGGHLATWHCAAFVSPHPCDDDRSCYSTLEIVGVIIIIIIIIHI